MVPWRHNATITFVALVLFGFGEVYLRTRYDSGLSIADVFRVAWAAALVMLVALGVARAADGLFRLVTSIARPVLLAALLAFPTLVSIYLAGVETSLGLFDAVPALAGSTVAILLLRERGAFAEPPPELAGSLALLGLAVVLLIPAQYGHDRWYLNGLPILMVVLGLVPITVSAAWWFREVVVARSEAQWLRATAALAVLLIAALPHIYPGILFYLKLLASAFAIAAIFVVFAGQEGSSGKLISGIVSIALISGAWSLSRPVSERFGALGYDSLAGIGAAFVSLPDDSDGDGFYASGVPIPDCDDESARTYPGSMDSPCIDTRQPPKKTTAPLEPQHVIVVLSDGLRAVDVYDPAVMPLLNAREKGRVRFDRAYSPGNTTRLSVKPMFTGVSTPTLVLEPQRSLEPDAWWFTGLGDPFVSRWIVASEFQWMHRDDQWTGRSDLEVYLGETDPSGRNIDASIDRLLVEFDKLGPDERAAFALFSTDPHREYVCDDGATDEIRCYHDELRALDRALTRLFDALEERGVANETMVILSSDHGEELGEHGHFGQHASTLFEEQIHVPLVVWYSPLSARNVAAPVSLLDLYATLNEVTGQKTRGYSLTPHFRGPTGQRPVLSHHWTGLVLGVGVRRTALIMGDDKFEYDWRTGHARYVPLADDPTEQKNHASSYPGRSRDLLEVLHLAQTREATESRSAF